MATILSFKEVADIPGARITTNTNQERAMTVTLQNWKFFKFKECKSGIYFYDTENKYDKAEENNNINNNIIIDYSCLKTFKENTNLLTKEETARSSKAIRYQSILSWTSTTSYIAKAGNNMIINCDINTDDINRSSIIWGPVEYVWKIRRKRKKPNKHNRITKLTLPLSLLRQHKIITIYKHILQ